ncbi:4521_t:CDS:2 [Dentiscutata erythropus]|uniref:4521_t:CDS:1 n=1 Tax=Dentiscutata erythropus TaxID=1348616 RepID=A0A9N9H015_9GLOM|nr:4521_t:CDS:2 [Dentiscutata erythropus]
MLNEDSNIKRRRVARACDSCRRKKVRCDGVQTSSDPPSCTNCKTYGYECSFIDAPKKRGPPKGYIEALETRLQRMESVLGNLVQSGDLPESTISSNLEWINVNESNFRHSQGSAIKGRTSPKSYDASIPRDASISNTTYVKFSKDNNSSDSEDGLLNDTSFRYDLADSSGQLAIDEIGRTRYFGSSSNVLTCLKLFKKIPNGQFLCIHGGSPIKNTTPAVIMKFPPKELCDKLLDTFWKYFHHHMIFIDKLDLMEKYNNLEANIPSIVLLYAIFAIASKKLDTPEVRKDSNKPSTAGEEYYNRAREILRNEFEQQTIATVQALLILSVYDRDSTTSVTWLYTGMAIRLAQDMGLHRDSAKWNFDARQAEIRKRVWWACVISDRLASTSLGRPVAINEADYDVEYPVFGVIPEEPHYYVEEWIELIKISLILGRVYIHVYGINNKPTLNVSNDGILPSLDAELNEWRENLPPGLQYESSATTNDKLENRQMLLHVIYYTCQILLHRPHIRVPKSKIFSSSIPSLSICTMAANNLTHIIHRMVKSGLLRASWSYSVYPFFSATTVHIINVLSDDDRFKEVAKHGIRVTLKCLSYLNPYWFGAQRTILLIKDLLKVKDIEFDGIDDIHDEKELVLEFKDRAPTEESDSAQITFASPQKTTTVSSQASMKSQQHIVNQPISTVINNYDTRDHNNSTHSSLSSPMNYEQTSPTESTSSSSNFMRFNDYPLNPNSGMFPPSNDSFAQNTSPLLFGDRDDRMGENNSSLSFPSVNDLNGWTNWTKYMIRLQMLKASGPNSNNNVVPSNDNILASTSSNTGTSSSASLFSSMSNSRGL